jgi:hypothetical protein
MDDVLIKQLTHQLKFLNFWIRLFGVMFLIGFIVIGLLIYKVVSLEHKVNNNISNFEIKAKQTLDVGNQLHL